MSDNQRMKKSLKAYGSIIAGLCLIVLGVALSLGSKGIASVLCALCLLAIAGVALYARFSKKHGKTDAKSEAHDGKAASFAHKAILVVLGVVCCVGLITGAALNLAAMCAFVIGLALLIYGCVLAWLERK